MGFLYSQLFVTPTYPSKSFEGQTVIVTGSNVGLGREAARHIARLGAAKVIIAVRNLEAGEEARQDIISTTKCSPDVVEVWKLDLSDYASVKAFAKRADKELERIDVLLENAGIATDKFNLAEGHERTITVNVISTFLLALMLVPKLKKTATDFNVKPHLVIVSSEVHAWSKFPEWKNEQGIFKALDINDPKSMAERYQTSKLLEVLVIRHIAPKLEGSGVIMNFVNPGLCHSELARDSGWTLYIMKLLLARTTEVGSRNLVIAASIGPDSHGKYISDTKIDQGSLSSFVTSKDGETAAFRVWKELKDILENIQKGVTSGF